MRRLHESLFAGLTTLAMSVPAHAAVLSYNEAVDGDIGWPTTFVLDHGTNVIQGTVSNPIGGVTDFDTFAATVPTSMVLDSIELTLTSAANGSGAFPLAFNVWDGSSASILNADVSAGGNFLFNFGFAITGLDLVQLNTFPAGMIADYRIDINLSPSADIPVPAAAAVYLGALALGGLAWRRKRRHSA